MSFRRIEITSETKADLNKKREQISDLEQLMKNSGAKERIYQVNYRLGDTKLKKLYQHRYDALMDRLKLFDHHARHDSTSSFLVKSHLITAKEILEHLSDVLDPDVDSLHVVEVIGQNRIIWPT